MKSNFKKISLVLTLLFSLTKIDAQYVSGTIGLSAGSESVLGLPKIGVQYHYYDKNDLNLYVGAEGSVWLMFVFMYAANVMHGVEYKFISFENSLGFFQFPTLDLENGSDPIGPYQHMTYTPRLGIKLGQIQLKFGPSFFLWKDYVDEDYGPLNFTKINKLHYNFELVYHFGGEW